MATENEMRRKLIAMAYNIGWTVFSAAEQKHKADMPRIYQWVEQYGCRAPAPLRKYTKADLATLLSQFERVETHTLKKKEL